MVVADINPIPASPEHDCETPSLSNILAQAYGTRGPAGPGLLANDAIEHGSSPQHRALARITVWLCEGAGVGAYVSAGVRAPQSGGQAGAWRVGAVLGYGLWGGFVGFLCMYVCMYVYMYLYMREYI
jgi:hypothetical protein